MTGDELAWLTDRYEYEQIQLDDRAAKIAIPFINAHRAKGAMPMKPGDLFESLKPENRTLLSGGNAVMLADGDEPAVVGQSAEMQLKMFQAILGDRIVFEDDPPK